MNHKSHIEAALERSLRQQVTVPQLDDKFDAAVFARIAAEEARAMTAMPLAPAIPAAARWLHVINVVGLAGVTICVSVYFAQMLAGVDLNAFLPEFSAATHERVVSLTSLGTSVAAVLFGLMYTPWGRRIWAELS